MKITGTSNYIKVEIDNKTVKIEGELLLDGFVAYADTIKKWEPPYENIRIDEATKEMIIKAVIKETKDSKLKVEFE